MRINRYLSHYGVCSRREADRLVELGRVMIGDRVAVPGDQAEENDIVFVDGRRVDQSFVPVVLAFNKPVGVVCTTSEKERPNLRDVIDYEGYIFSAGRLDKDSSGLIFLTNDGMLSEELMRGRNDHEKEYMVKTDRPLRDDIVVAMEQGVPLSERMTKPCRITDRHGCEFNMTITEGMNRQIRRMCEYFGYRVKSLKRIRIGTYLLGDLPEGKYRVLSDDEVKNII